MPHCLPSLYASCRLKGVIILTINQNRHMTNPMKSLEYAYPTSKTATDYGYAKTGCWMVATKTKDHRTIGRKAFDSKEAAQAAFNAMNAEIYQFSH